DLETLTARAADAITIGNRTASREDAVNVLAKQLESVPQYTGETRRVPLGIYRGLRFGLVLHPHGAPDLYLEGAATRQSMLSREHHGARAILNAAERLVSA